jgi:GrpB-like predicted nucleotidyltransferase (UPF0157 family)
VGVLPSGFESLLRHPSIIIGSTSVPGLGGRPVLDSVVVAPTVEHASAVESLKRARFEDFPYGAVRAAAVERCAGQR